MAKLRKFQFYRNGQANQITNDGGIVGQQNYNVSDLKSAYVYAEALFKQTEKHNEMEDGEILLYRFSYAGQVHTLVGVVHASETTKSLEVLANYDMLGAEISNEISAAINALDVENVPVATETDNIVTFNGIKQEDGKIATGTTGISLAKVAKTGAAVNVSIADAGSVIQATTVEGALQEIAAEIDGMDLDATDVVALNTDKNALQAGKIKEEDGKVTVATAVTLVEFNQALTNGNKVATMADVTAATVAGQDAIVVANAPQGQTGKVVSLKINGNDQVLTQTTDGLLANISLTYDSTNKKIKLFGKEGVNAATASLGEIDASNFIKDGMLEKAEIVSLGAGEAGEGKPAGEYIKLTFNTDAEQDPIYINVSELCDVYTVDNIYLQLNAADKFKIEHKTSGVTAGQYGADAAATLETAGESITFNVPSITVDAAGHVTAASEKTIKVELPATRTAATVTVSEITNLDAKNVQDALEELQGDIDAINAVNWNGDGEIIVNDTTHTISHKQHTFDETNSVETTAVKSVVIPQLTVNGYGHVTAIDNKTFTIDCNVPTVSGTTGQIVVTSTPAEGTEDINYTVGLAKVVTGDATNVAPTESTDDYALKSVETNGPQQHTRVENITVDAYGRVTAYTLTTVEENWDCGTWE